MGKGISLIFLKLFLVGYFILPLSLFGDNCKNINLSKFKNIKPTVWGEHFEGIIDTFDTSKKEIALTFDACGGKYDKELIDFLIDNNIKATLFFSGKWLEANGDTAKFLSKKSDLFEIENHGWRHIPLSANGQSAYGIKGTNSVDEIVEEICKNSEKIIEVTSLPTKFFRAGTANYDNVAIEIAKALGYKIAGFSVNGDFGATAKKELIYKQITTAPPGSIILCHMNHPEKETFEGVKDAVLYLKGLGFSFVKLQDVVK